MSDELDQLEKDWEESKSNPEISLREMWDREEAYRRKKEEEDAEQRRKEEARKREEERKEKEREEEKRRAELQRQFDEEQKKQSGSSSAFNPFSRDDRNEMGPIPPPGGSGGNENSSGANTGPVADALLSFVMLCVCGLVVAAPFFALFHIKKVIKAVVWGFSHWLCIVSLLVLGYSLIWTFLCEVIATLLEEHKYGKIMSRVRICLYSLGVLLYAFFCWIWIKDGSSFLSIVFPLLPVALYFPSIFFTFWLIKGTLFNKTFWTYKNLISDNSFGLILLFGWGVIVGLLLLLGKSQYAACEIKMALSVYGNILAAIGRWFIGPISGI